MTTNIGLIETRMEEIIHSENGQHPFLNNISKDNVESVLSEYGAMSQLFPYIQAKAIGEAALASLNRGDRIKKNIELTSSVGAFLVADEMGVYHIANTQGNPGLPNILNTSKNFHFNMLQSDISDRLGLSVQPNYSETTMEYMTNLGEILSSCHDSIRCAAMVAFEAHAEQMIEALWTGILSLYPNVDKDSLDYFRIHVGGDDPAEAYHVAMTTKMIESLVTPGSEETFLGNFEEAYKMNYNWCDDIIKK